MKKHISYSVKALLVLAALCACSIPALSQFNSIIKGVAKPIIKKEVKKAAAKQVSEEAVKKAFVYGGERIGKNTVENAVGKQAARTVVRNKVYKEIEQKGIKSILQYSMRRAAPKLEYVSSTSAVKVLSHRSPSFYADGMRTSMGAAKKNFASQTRKTIENSAAKTTASAGNAQVVKRFAKKYGISADKEAKLLKEMANDDGLAKLINDNPALNIKRWLNTRNPVNKDLITKLGNGRLPQNAGTYAGNVFYFNPHLNSGLKARLERGGGMVNLKKKGSQLSYDELVRLDKKYPGGVPFTKEGFPDFTKVAVKDQKGNPVIVDLGKKFTGTDKDQVMAEELFHAKGNKYGEELISWHHIENSTSLVRVPREIHEIVSHAGGRSTSKMR